MNTKRKRMAGYILTVVLLAAAVLAGLTVSADCPEDSLIELFVFSPCESCREGETFEKTIRAEFAACGLEGGRKYRSYNVFHEEERRYMENCFRKLGMEFSLTDSIPAAVMDGKVYFGDYDTIARQLSGNVEPESASENSTDPVLQEEGSDGIRGRLEELEKTDTEFVLFTTASCDSCRTVKTWMEEYLSGLPVKTAEESIMEPSGYELLRRMMQYYEVPDEEQQVPVLFYRGGYLSGEKAICEGIPELLAQESFTGSWTDIGEEIREAELPERQVWWKILLTGFVNDLNPCGMSMLLMVLSLLMNTESGFLKGSLSYLARKFIAYLFMGTGAFFLFAAVETSGFFLLERVLTAAFAVLAFLIGILNFVDYRNVRRKQYGKVIVQLPAALRKKNHRWIEKLKQIPAAFLIPFLFGLGVVISMGEFFCTGQMYAASVLYMARMQSRITAEIVLWLLLYVSAMCLPLLLLILVIQKSRNLLAVSRITLEGMPAIKCINGVFFLILSWMLVCSL